MRISIVLLTVLLAACMREPDISPAEAQGFLAAAEDIMQNSDLQGSIPEQEWPKEIAALEPESVRMTPEWLYVVTDSWFVEEAGLFVPRGHSGSVNDTGEPQFRHLHEKIFSYRISG